MQPRASIVTVCYGKRDLTERMLASLERAFGSALGTEIELVLVDNASPDDTADLLRTWESRATVLLLDENRNYAGGNNAGARAARGDVLVFLNNDTEVPPGALEPLVELALQSDVGGVGARLLYPDGSIQHGGVVFRDDGRFGMQPFHLFQHEDGDLAQAQATYDLDVVTAACFAMRREVFLSLNGFDEAYVNGYEDVDLCLRARVAGYRIVYSGGTHVVHNESATRGHGWNMAENDRILHNRWDHALGDDDETLRALFDARIDRERPPATAVASPLGAGVVVEGLVSGIGATGAEARALLRTLELAGLAPATRDWTDPFVGPTLRDQQERCLLAVSRLRAARGDAVRLHVPVPGSAALPAAVSVLRLGHVPEALPPTAVWAASPALAAELVALGAPSAAVEYLPPPLADFPCLPGGRGLLVVLPGAEVAARAVLAQAARYDGQVRVLPPARSPLYEALVAELLPGAELLGPISCEIGYAAAAGEADVVLCPDSTDPFQRRALIAAAVGSAPVVPAGPARAVLGAEAPAGTDEADITLQARRSRAALVAGRCSAAALAPRVAELVESARAASYRLLRRAA